MKQADAGFYKPIHDSDIKPFMTRPSSDHKLLALIRQSLNKNPWFHADDSVLIAVSGGADSVVLLDLLTRVQKPFNLKLAVCHLNHGLRGSESDRDCDFVKHLAGTMDIPFYSGFRDVAAHQKTHRLSLEEAARQLRYEFLFETADRHGYQRIATAHHADDNAELVLMNLMRGSGPAGLSGMAHQGFENRLIRPLLEITRSEIMDYLTWAGLSFREDRSNQDRTILRNRIRLELLPDIERSYQHGFSRILTRTARIVRDDEAWMDSLVEPLFQSLVMQKTFHDLTMSCSALTRLHVAAQRRIIRKAIGQVKGDLRRITLSHVNSVVELINRDKGHGNLDLPGQIRIRRDRDELTIVKETKPLRQCPPDAPIREFCYTVERPSSKYFSLHLPETGHFFRFSVLSESDLSHPEQAPPETALLDMSRLDFPLTFRNIRQGDRFTPLGMKGHQNVSRFFINTKTPQSVRARCPVLVSGQDIVWVCGHRIDNAYRLNPETEKVLKIELLLA